MVGAILSMSAMGGLVLLFREPLARSFTDDPEVIRLTIAFIWIVTVVQPMMAVEFAIGGALRGAGDTLFPLVVIFVGLFVCRLIPAGAMVTWWDVTVEMVWCALIADWTVKAAMLLVRYRKGKWKELEV